MHLRDYIHSDRINNFSCFSKSYLLDYLLQTRTILDEICTYTPQRRILYLLQEE